MDFQLCSLGFNKEHQDCASALVNLAEDRKQRKFGQQNGNDHPTGKTPVHHRLDESGYHSMQRNRVFTSPGKRRHSYFTTEESFEGNLSFESPQKRLHQDQLSFVDSEIDQSISSTSKLQDDFLSDFEIIECLGFEPSPDLISSSESDEQSLLSDVENSFQQLEYHTEESGSDKNPPPQLEVLLQPADCITDLHRQNCYGILSTVLSYLSDKDLTSASVVCRAWNDVIKDDQSSRKRKLAYLQKRQNICKENHTTHYFVSPQRRGIRAGILGDVLNSCHENKDIDVQAECDIINVPLLQITNEPIDSKLMMQKCPVCAFACEIQPSILKTICERKTCQYEFCAKCLGPYNHKHTCTLLASAEDMPEVIIVMCSKKWKKSLQRLKF